MSFAPKNFDDRTAPPPAAAWTPRLVTADDDDVGCDDLTPSSRLSEIYFRWYRPEILIELNESAKDTLDENDVSMGYWQRLTGDPPIEQITKLFWNEKFRDALKTATWRRGLSGGSYPLAENTQIKHLTQVHAVYARCGASHGKVRGLGLLDELAQIAIDPRPEKPPEPAFEFEQPQTIFANCHAMTIYGAGVSAKCYRHKRGDGGPGADSRWRVLLALMYYGGFRIGAMRGLCRRHVKRYGRRNYIDMPRAEAGLKKKEPVFKYVHRHAWSLLQPHLAACEHDDCFVFPFLRSHSEKHLLDRHEYLQTAAGIQQPLPFHAWRRTNGNLMEVLEPDEGLRRAQRALGHASIKTTRKYYVEVEPRFIEMLPPLDPQWKGEEADPDQGLLF